VSEQGWSQGKPPDFAWIPEWKGLSKLLLSSQKKQDIAQGRSLRYFVYPWGITWINGEREGSARWDDITQVFRAVTRHSTNGAPTYTEYNYTFKLADGRSGRIYGRLPAAKARASGQARIQSTPGGTTPVTIEQLGRLLESAVTRVQLPKAAGRFNEGQPISFGPLTVSSTGISSSDQSLPWSEIQDISTRQGIVSVKKSGKWLAWKRTHVSQIPNYFVFDALVHAILDQRSRR